MLLYGIRIELFGLFPFLVLAFDMSELCIEPAYGEFSSMSAALSESILSYCGFRVGIVCSVKLGSFKRMSLILPINDSSLSFVFCVKTGSNAT